MGSETRTGSGRALVLYRPDPFSAEITRAEVRPGSSVQDALDEVGCDLPSTNLRVLVDSVPVHPLRWSETRLEAGQAVTAINVPRDPITFAAIVSSIVTGLNVAASFTVGFLSALPVIGGQLAAGAGFLFGGAGLVGSSAATVAFGASVGNFVLGVASLASLAQGFLSRPAAPDFGGAGGLGSVSPSLTGVGNSIRPFQPIPVVFGKIKIFPPLGAFPFTEIAGGNQFVRILLIVGHGEVDINAADVMIGQQPALSFPDSQVVVRPGAAADGPLTIFSDQVLQEQVNITFVAASATEPAISEFVTRTTADDTEEIRLDFTFFGLKRINENGKPRPFSVALDIEFSIAGVDSFSKLPQQAAFSGLGGDGNATLKADGTVILTGITTQPFFKSFGASVAKNTYDVRVRRIETNPASNRAGGGNEIAIFSDFSWTALKSFRFDSPPIVQDRVSTIEIRVRLSDQLGGNVANVNVICTGKARVYDPAGATGEPRDSDDWTTTQVTTQNPAAWYRDVIQGLANPVPLLDSQIDIPQLSSWFTFCATSGFEYNVYQDVPVTFAEMLQSIAASAQAELSEIQGKISVVIDQTKPVISQVLTVRTASGDSTFEVRQTLPSVPHAFIVRHVDIDQGYEPNVETFVFRDGFSSDGAGGTTVATVFETLQLTSAVTRARATQFGRLLFAMVAARRRTFFYPTDLEHLTLIRGDRVKLRHDTALIGLGDGRLTSVELTSRFDSDIQDMNTNPVDAGDIIGLVTGPIEFDTIFSPRLSGIGLLTALSSDIGFGSFIIDTSIFGDHVGQILRVEVYLPTGLNTESGRIFSITATDGSLASIVKLFDESVFPRDQWNTVEIDLELDNTNISGTPEDGIDTSDVAQVNFGWGLESPDNRVDRIFIGPYEFRENKLRPLHEPESKMQSLTGLTSQNSVLVVDSADKDQGTASIEMTASSAAVCGLSFDLDTRFPLGLNMVGRRIKIRVRPEVGFPTSATDMVRLILITNTDHTSTYFFGTADGVVVDSWETLTVDLDVQVPDLTGLVNPVDLTQVFTVQIQYNNNSPANGRVLNTDQWEIEDKLDIVEFTGDGPPIYQADQPYGMVTRTIDTGAVTLESQRMDLLNPVAQNEPDLRSNRLTLDHPFTTSLIPLVGDSYAFGLRNLETLDCLVRAIETGPDLSATLELIDYAEGVFDLEDPVAFAPGTSLPLPSKLLGPGTPRIVAVVSDETALVETRSSELKPRIWVSVLPAIEPSPTEIVRPETAFYQPQIRLSLSDPNGIASEYKNIPQVDASSEMVSFVDVEQDLFYDIRIRAVSSTGTISDFATVIGHQVVGQTTPPPDVEGLRVEGSFLQWDVPFELKDLRGFEVRYAAGQQTNFDQGLKLHGDMPVFPPFSLDSVRTGPATLLVKAVDRAENFSVNPAVVFTTIVGKDIDNVVRTIDLHDDFTTLQISGENVEIFDGMDSTTGWATVNGTLTLLAEGDDVFTSPGSLRNVSGTSGLSQLRKIGFTSEDWEDRLFKIRVFLDANLNPRPTNMLRIVIQSTPSGSAAILFGTDDGLVVNAWNEITIDMTQLAIDVPTLFPDAIVNLLLHHNVSNGVAGGRIVWDDIRTVGGGTLETLDIEGGSGDLVTQEIGSFYSDDPSSLFYNPDGGVGFYDANFKAGTYRFEFIPVAADIPGRLTLEVNENTGVPLTILYRNANPFFYDQDGTSIFYKNPTDLFYNQSNDITQEPFVAWPGRLDVLELTTYQFELSLPGGPIQGRISQFDITVDVPDQVQVVEDFAVAATGDPRLTLTKVFRSINEVILTSQQNASNETPRAVLMDKQNTQGAGGGPHIRTFKDDGTRQIGKVDARIIGVPA